MKSYEDAFNRHWQYLYRATNNEAVYTEFRYKEVGVIEILKLIVEKKEERGKGHGTKTMQLLCDFADQHGFTLALSPSTVYGASSIQRLYAFYRRFGFEKNQIAKYRVLCNTTHKMIRTPKQNV